MTKGRNKEARDSLNFIAKVNGRKFIDAIYDKLEGDQNEQTL